MEHENSVTDARRARINRLKKIILTFLFTAWILPVILCIVLFVKQGETEKHLNEISEKLELLLEAKNATEPIQPVEETKEIQVTKTVLSPVQNREKETVPEVEEQEAPKQEEECAEAAKQVYLTFDDGPSSRTNDILDILAQYDIKATFFINGKEGEYATDAMKRIVEEGHTLGMHSYSHKYETIYKSEEAFMEDFHKIHDYIYEVCGYDSRVYRFPGGSSNSISRIDMTRFGKCLYEEGVVYFDWNMSSQDATKTMLSVNQIVENSVKGLDKHSECVILFHDSDAKASTVEALPLLIERIKKDGDVVFLPITDTTEPVQHVKTEYKTEERTEE